MDLCNAPTNSNPTDSPNPRPTNWWEKNGSKILSRVATSMPHPVSATERQAYPSAFGFQSEGKNLDPRIFVAVISAPSILLIVPTLWSKSTSFRQSAGHQFELPALLLSDPWRASRHNCYRLVVPGPMNKIVPVNGPIPYREMEGMGTACFDGIPRCRRYIHVNDTRPIGPGQMS